MVILLTFLVKLTQKLIPDFYIILTLSSSTSYEKWSSKVIVAILIAMQWAVGGSVLIIYALGQVGTGLRISFCHLSTKTTHNRYIGVLYAVAVNDVLACVIVLLLFLYNKKLKDKVTNSQCTLTTRYQVSEMNL